MRKKTLILCLKYKWFSLIASGEKTEEYREINPYYAIKLRKQYNEIMFVMGRDWETYVKFKNPKIRIDQGRPEWGAKAGKRYYVITWDKE